jgi:pyruvate/2-oxoglutarate dehydrogenase complex dihydrolipoamide acyltransferase (E2) component
METEKAVFEVPSPVAGKITEIQIDKGQEVKVGEVIAKVETEEEQGEGEKEEQGEGRKEKGEEKEEEAEKKEKEAEDRRPKAGER